MEHQVRPSVATCIAPLTISRSSSPFFLRLGSPSLSHFDWFSPFGEFLNWSAADDSGQGLSVMTTLRPFVLVADHYELECQMRGNCRDTRENSSWELVRKLLVSHKLWLALTWQLKINLRRLIKNYLSIPLARQSLPVGWPHNNRVMQLLLLACSTYATFGNTDVALNTLNILLNIFDSSSETVDYLNFQGLRNFCRIGLEVAICCAFKGDVEGAEESLIRALRMSPDLDCTKVWIGLGVTV